MNGFDRSQVFLLLVVFALLLLFSLLAHLGRLLHKGEKYQFLDFQDGFYYVAMAYNLFQAPMSVGQELLNISQFNGASEQALEFYKQNPTQWHLENGLSHSPPYVYRVLAPTLVSFLTYFGISVENGFLVVSATGLAITGIILTLLFRRAGVNRTTSIFYTFCVGFASINLIMSPISVDQLSIAMNLLCIYLHRLQRRKSSYIISGIAVLTRETSLVFWLFLVLDGVRAHRKTLFTIREMIFVLIPPAMFVFTRAIVNVPNPDYPLHKIFQIVMEQNSISRIFPLMIFTVLSSSFLFFAFTRDRSSIPPTDYLLISVAIFGLAVSSLLGGNWERYLLLFWPMLILYESLSRIRSKNQLVALGGIGILFLGINDVLTFNLSISSEKHLASEILFLLIYNYLLIKKVNKTR